MDDFVELDEEKIENLDSELNIEKQNANNAYRILEKKLKKSRIVNIFVSIIAVISIVVASVFGGFLYYSYNGFNPLLKHFMRSKVNVSTISQVTKNNPIDIQSFANKLSFIDDIIGEMYYYDKNNKAIEDGMFKGYLQSLGDKYAEYYPAKEYADFTAEMTEGIYYGIGCIVTYDKKGKECVVQKVYKDSPAEKGGLMEGDVFVAVDGENIKGKDTEYLVSKIKGEEGTKREIVVYRKSEDKEVTLTCYCGKVDIELVNYKVIGDNIGFLDVDQFTGKAASQFINAVDELMSKQIKGLIIDLRGNGGGELMTVLTMLDYLVRDKDGRYTLNQKEEVFESGRTLLVYIKEREKIIDAAYAEDKHSIEIPMVILTDVSTASAAELFTAALRDYKKATIVGTRTFGKGVVQNMIEYEDGSAIKFTTSEYFPPSGYSIDKMGILPDYSLDYSGTEVIYNEKNKILVNDESDNKQYIIDIDGSIIEENDLPVATASTIATSSEVATLSTIIKPHVENLKIYDEDNSFLDEDWYNDLYDEYEDKQLVQALVVMRDKLK